MQPDRSVQFSKDDLFSRAPFARSIADLIRKRTDKKCIVFGVNGPWGEGKSTVLNFIHESLQKDHPQIIQIKFNPWRFNDETSFLESFFATVSKDIKAALKDTEHADDIKRSERKKDWKKLVDTVTEYGDSVSDAVSYIPVPGSGIAGKIIGTTLKKIPKLSTTEIEDKKRTLEELLTKYSKKVVVYIDDIDRLAKEEVYAIFRLVKLTGDFDNFIYILAYDEQMVANAIAHRFSEGDVKAGHSFLEKIVQIPIRLPELSYADLSKFFSNSLTGILTENNLSMVESESLRFGEAFSSSLMRSLDSPRKVVRFSNALHFAIPLTAGEVNLVDLILFEGLKIFFPAHYALIRDNQNLFIQSHSNASDSRKVLESKFLVASQGLTEQQISDIKTLIQALFPFTQTVWSTHYYTFDAKWVKDRRITAQEYFPKYLTFSMSDGQVSDREFDQMILNIKASDSLSTISHINSILSKSNAYDFIQKLRYMENEFSIEESKKLSSSICQLGHLFEKGIGLDASTSSSGQAGILIKRLIWNIKDQNERFNQSLEVLKNSSPIEFGFEILKWLPVRSDSETGENFDDDQILQFQNVLVQRVLTSAGTKPFFTEFPDIADKVIDFWSKNNKDEVATYLSSFTDKNIETCISFLKSIVGKIYTSSIPITSLEPVRRSIQTGNFTKERYDFMNHTCGTDWLAQSLTKCGVSYEQGKSNLVLDTKYSNDQSDNNLIQQFLYWDNNSITDQPDNS